MRGRFHGPALHGSRAPSLKFAKIAPLYLVCWMVEKSNRQEASRFHPSGIPPAFLQRWQQIPMRIFAAGKDDYNDRDPDACASMIETIPDERQRALTSLVVYPEATHGWDQNSAVFYEPVGCKGRGCTNRNIYNRSVVEEAKTELLRFFSEQ